MHPILTPHTPAVPATTTEKADTVLREKLLIDIAGLAQVTSLSVRTLRRMDAARDIPGRVTAGRRVLFQLEVIREWARAGLPGREQWAALLKSNTKR
jgi:hypothetical protein